MVLLKGKNMTDKNFDYTDALTHWNKSDVASCVRTLMAWNKKNISAQLMYCEALQNFKKNSLLIVGDIVKTILTAELKKVQEYKVAK